MNVGKKVLVGVHLVIMAKEIGKGTGKDFEKEINEIIGILFMKIMEIEEKEGEMTQVACEEEIEGK